ncbi:MAG: DUF5602 domain-containing protein [Candidatus Latescibacterota bacterium]
MSRCWKLLPAGALCLAALGCDQGKDPVSGAPEEPAARLAVSATEAGGWPGRMVFGDTVAAFGAQLTTWARMGARGQVHEIGFTLPLSAVENAADTTITPGGGFTSVVAQLPAPVSATTFVNHLALDWGPEGHEPPGVYDVPHFDIHFYGVDPQSVAAVDCSDETLPSAASLPPGYFLPPDACVPQMGMHALDSRSPELFPVAPVRFASTVVLGYYGGFLTFLEPMISRERLLLRQDLNLRIPVPAGLAPSTRYPTRFRATYDPDADAYRMALGRFVTVGL